MYRSIRQGQRHVFAVAWVTYAGYYLCRLNFSQVQNTLGQDLGLSPFVLGQIILAHSICYVLGQFINGLACDRAGARAMAATGAFGSAAMCAILPSLQSASALAVVWGANGFFQSMGFSACVRALANWFEPSQRGRINGVYAVSFQVGHVCAWLLAAAAAKAWGWHYAFYVPAGILTAVGILALLRLVDRPELVGLTSPAADTSAIHAEVTPLTVLRNTRVWYTGLAASFVSVGVYGFMFWLPNYLQAEAGVETQMASASRAMLFPLAGCAGALAVGWISDHWLKGSRMPAIVVFAGLGAVAVWAFGVVKAAEHPGLNAVVLWLSGFLLIGAQIHIVGTLAMDLGGHGATGSSVGTINALNNLGAIAASIGTGAVVDNERLGWAWVFPLWALACAIGAGSLAILWMRPAEKT